MSVISESYSKGYYDAIEEKPLNTAYSADVLIQAWYQEGYIHGQYEQQKISIQRDFNTTKETK